MQAEKSSFQETEARLGLNLEESEAKPFIIDEFMRIDMFLYHRIMALGEAIERKGKAEDFVRRYPYISHAKQLSMLSQEQIVLPPQKSAIPGKKKRR